MKNKILTVLVYCSLAVSLCVLSGCSDEEIIELSEKDSIAEDNKENEVCDADSELHVSESLSDVKIQEHDAGAVTDNNEMTESPDSDSLSFVVYVCGEVKNPGIYELSEGARIFDAIEASGGFTESAYESYVNMASYVSDEQMIYVPSDEEIKEYEACGEKITDGFIAEGVSAAHTKINGINSAENTSNGGDGNGTLVNINTADKEELMTIKGVGESKADKIIAYREEHGGFSQIEDIMNITGIKEGMFNKVKDQICVK